MLSAYYLIAEGDPDDLQPWLIPVDGAAPRRLSVEVDGRSGAAFSPDGTRIAMASAGGLFLTARDGNRARLLSKPDSGSYRLPLWSPSGDRIAVTNTPLDPASHESIEILDVATGTAETIHTSSGREVTAADWSPDGQAVLVVQGEEGIAGEATLWSVPADGSGGHVLVERAASGSADWRWIAVGPKRATPSPEPTPTPIDMGEVRIGLLDPGSYQTHLDPTIGASMSASPSPPAGRGMGRLSARAASVRRLELPSSSSRDPLASMPIRADGLEHSPLRPPTSTPKT